MALNFSNVIALAMTFAALMMLLVSWSRMLIAAQHSEGMSRQRRYLEETRREQKRQAILARFMPAEEKPKRKTHDEEDD